MQKENIKQKYLGEKGLIFLIVLLTAVIPLSIDIYLPALPSMTEVLKGPKNLVDYTLIGFFISFGISTLIWGPISEKYGRKPILIIGDIIFIIGSFLCSKSESTYSIVVYRICQAIGCGAIFSVAGAMVKDCFEGKKREVVMSLVQSMAMIAPLIAPLIGGIILKFTSWRVIFTLLTVFGLVSLFFIFLFQESLEEKHEGSLISSLGKLIVVGKNPNFSILMIIFLISKISNMGYVSASSYIYQDFFKLNPQVYSYFFAGNAIFAILGPLLVIKLTNIFNYEKIVKFSLTASIISGFLVFILGKVSPIIFLLTVTIFTFFNGMIRPLGTNLMFMQQKNDAGSASSLMNFVGTILGSLGMVIVSFNKDFQIKMIGICIFTLSLISLILWYFIHNKIIIEKHD